MQTTRPEDLGLCSSRLNNINQLTEKYIQEGALAGTITLIARRGKIAHLECRGMMDIDSSTAMRADAIFRIYSMTKPVTSVAAMMLYERGVFDLLTPISNFIPEFKHSEVYLSGHADDYETVKPEREINIADLLTHTSGMTYDYTNVNAVDELYRRNEVKSFNHSLNLTDFTKQAAKMPILFSPGKHWNYGISTDVLGRIIEIASGMSLDAFFKKEIFTPLEMSDTDFYVPKEKQDRFTTGYAHYTAMPADARAASPEQTLFMFDRPDSGLYSQAPIMLSGGGGLCSTASDYLKFTSMLINKGCYGKGQHLLSPKTIALMTTNQLPTELADYRYYKDRGAVMPGNGFGFGFAMNLNPASSKLIGSGGEFGWSGAANTYFIVDPKEELIAMFLTQLFPFDLTQEMYRRFKVAAYQSIVA